MFWKKHKKHLYVDIHVEDARWLEFAIAACDYEIDDISESKLSEDRIVCSIVSPRLAKLDSKRLGKYMEMLPFQAGWNLTVYPQS